MPISDAPVLTWIVDNVDDKPDFDITFDDAAGEGATISWEIATDSGFTSVVASYSDTLDAAEVLASLVEYSASSLPGEGTYYGRANVTDGEIVSDWSNTVVITIGPMTIEATGFAAGVAAAVGSGAPRASTTGTAAGVGIATGITGASGEVIVLAGTFDIASLLAGTLDRSSTLSGTFGE